MNKKRIALLLILCQCIWMLTACQGSVGEDGPERSWLAADNEKRSGA